MLSHQMYSLLGYSLFVFILFSYLLGKGTTNNSFIATKLDINFQYETILSDIFFLNHKLISPIHVF